MAQHCVHCGTEVYDEGNFCHVCGKSKTEIPNGFGAAPKPVVLPPDAETTFFRSGTVTVTNAGFTVPGRTFAMSDVKGVRFEKASATRSWPTALYLLGLGSLLADFTGSVLSCYPWGPPRFDFQPKFTIVLDSGSGDVTAFTSIDRDYISEIVDALIRPSRIADRAGSASNLSSLTLHKPCAHLPGFWWRLFVWCRRVIVLSANEV